MIVGEGYKKPLVGGVTKVLKTLQCMEQSHTVKTCPDTTVHCSLIIKHCLDSRRRAGF